MKFQIFVNKFYLFFLLFFCQKYLLVYKRTHLMRTSKYMNRINFCAKIVKHHRKMPIMKYELFILNTTKFFPHFFFLNKMSKKNTQFYYDYSYYYFDTLLIQKSERQIESKKNPIQNKRPNFCQKRITMKCNSREKNQQA
eukprot:TRINITY_DN18502_c1_g1_i1.p3 TRINITY_DN18502_c1_g1~~TRINITY_DN18502_c1_g1_i1.p3  ORF type:complete len:140 (-),score=9.57 TRINITY_DN18502_c1_g1_i1:353-772(-)